jgi:hypothetical protein
MLIYFSFIIVGYLLGEFLRDRFLKKKLNPYVVGMIGILILKLLFIIPLISFFTILIGLGSIYILILNYKK